jgi:hypothetical protein
MVGVYDRHHRALWLAMVWCVLALIALTPLPSAADELPPVAAPAPIWAQYEFRMGALYHGAGFLGPTTEAGGVDLNLEVLSPRLGLGQGTPWAFLSPRLMAGGTLNFGGETSIGYAGFAWTWDITRNWYIEPTFGGAVHNGQLDVPASSGHLSLGCHELFRPSLSSGYRLNERWSVILTWEHISNANLCSRNAGLNNLGAKIGFAF